MVRLTVRVNKIQNFCKKKAKPAQRLFFLHTKLLKKLLKQSNLIIATNFWKSTAQRSLPKLQIHVIFSKEHKVE